MQKFWLPFFPWLHRELETTNFTWLTVDFDMPDVVAFLPPIAPPIWCLEVSHSEMFSNFFSLLTKLRPTGYTCLEKAIRYHLWSALLLFENSHGRHLFRKEKLLLAWLALYSSSIASFSFRMVEICVCLHSNKSASFLSQKSGWFLAAFITYTVPSSWELEHF